ncbi:MAG: DUF2520 domain-containing protein [Salinivirgaceae bacterium]|nr:DUF2520 domain-containing protein [Salinivirgaceae bacterium]
MSKPSISVIGAGNVATSLVPALLKSGYPIKLLAARTEKHLKDLAKRHNLPYTTDITATSADVIIICTSDNSIEKVAATLPSKPNQLVLHTAGSVSLNTISQYHAHSGVLYPLQTFSAERTIPFSEVPLCIETHQKSDFVQINAIATSISQKVRTIDSSERLKIHTAAVFVCNFTNLMYSYGADIMENAGLDFEILRPLIEETTRKATTHNPKKVQTGPALRMDTSTMEMHEKQLDEPMAKIYKVLSQWIIEFFNPKNR